MLRPLIILLIVLVMAPTIYVLFFTSVVDTMLLRMRLGARVKTISKTAAALDQSVSKAAEKVRDERDELDAALTELKGVASRRFSKPDTTFKPWAVRNTSDPDLFWSPVGWVSKDMASRFDADEKIAVTLPTNGKWHRFRKQPQSE
jgi:hypothetical protein